MIEYPDMRQHMKFQIASGQSENKQEEVPQKQERSSSDQREKATVTEPKEDSYIKKSYLAAKAEDGTVYIKNMLPDTGVSEDEIVETAEKFLGERKFQLVHRGDFSVQQEVSFVEGMKELMSIYHVIGRIPTVRNISNKIIVLGKRG